MKSHFWRLFLCLCILFSMTACNSTSVNNDPVSKNSEGTENVSSNVESKQEYSDEKEEKSSMSDLEQSNSNDNKETKPLIEMNVTSFELSDTITVDFYNTDSKDWIGLYLDGVAPGTINSITWKYAEGNGEVTFNAASLQEPGDYTVYLCDNDGYAVLDRINITVLDNDTTDYGAEKAVVNASAENGKREMTVTVTPSSSEKISYSVYWSQQNTRLAGYLPLATVEHAGKDDFEIKLNDCLVMPDAADGIEVSVKKGHSTSIYVPMTDDLKLPESNKLYEFQVLSDLHINADKPQHTAHLIAALDDIAVLSPDSEAIFCVGDNTDKGIQADYDLLEQILGSVDASLPPIYYAIGNHDMIYGTSYTNQVELFTENLSMPAVYYAGDIGNTRYIVLGSDTIVGEGTIGEQQLQFLKDELAKADKDKPVFIFLHQPLIDTVSGSLYSLDPDVQYWYGITPTGDQVRAILKEYPNAILFTGHTHWSFEMYQPLLFGNGADATFANTASVGYLWSDDDKAISGSEGYYVEVYEDYVLLKGREYTNGEWCAAAQFLIPLYR